MSMNLKDRKIEIAYTIEKDRAICKNCINFISRGYDTPRCKVNSFAIMAKAVCNLHEFKKDLVC